MPDETENLFDKLKSTVNSDSLSNVSLPPPAGSDSDTTVLIDFRQTLTCASASLQDAQDPDNQYDYFLLSFEVGFTPHNNEGLKSCSIICRALQDAASSINYSPIPVSSKEIEVAGNFVWKPSPTDHETMPNSVWMVTAPDSIDDGTSYSTNVSYSLGGNVGFFGGDVTGGIDASYTMSHGETVNVAPVRIQNLSSNEMLYVKFIPQSSQGTDFQANVCGILKIPDDGKGKRDISLSTTDARELFLEIRLVVSPTAQVGPTAVFYAEVAYHHFTRIVKVRLPPPVVIH